jgi:cell division protein FtsN
MIDSPTTARKSEATERPSPPAEASDAKPSIPEPVTKSAAPSNAVKPEYSVQVAAYRTRADAEKLVATLKNRGYEARVDEFPDWYRVRIGRYASEGAAESKLLEIKAKKMSGFVVRAPDR